MSLSAATGLACRPDATSTPKRPLPPTPAWSVGGYARHPSIEPTPSTQHFVFGRRSFFGYLVRADGEIYWFANITQPEPYRSEVQAIETDQWLARLTELHTDDPDPVPQILSRNTAQVRGYPIYDLPHVPRWGLGRVAAVGDAVHATSPSAGQGASLALEDAIVLGQCLRDIPTPERAFQTYEAIRKPRAEQVVRYAQQITKRKTISTNPVAVLARDLMLPVFLRRAASDTTARWLYDHCVHWDTPVQQPAS